VAIGGWRDSRCSGRTGGLKRATVSAADEPDHKRDPGEFEDDV
jgi:hypothetical protein